ncbi:MAG TPA: sigma-70 family RNA polymerase sigma factor [Candidatus Acidoferrales bacterium]|jgi:RNA polymerase sigma factor (sigma-70 family)|nr:sigma-70 family RNA polymerase sigma factor [Candidatus Acidoferrales bacterium]
MPLRREPHAKEKFKAWPDRRLVRECLNGNDEAWSILIDKYKNLIFSIPVKYHFSQDDASDVFQAVCLELLAELPKLRKPEALPKWIIQVTAHKCLHGKKYTQRNQSTDPNDPAFEQSTPARAESILREAEEEQRIRQVLDDLPPRCGQLMRMLFFEEPPRAYQEVARELGIAPGSIGFIRQRCLDRLRKKLLEAGFS